MLAAAALFFWGKASAEKIITLTFTGDCTLGTEEMTRNVPESFDNVAKAKGYSYFLENFYDLFSQDDCTVVNCEGVLSDSSKGEADKDFRFRGPEEFVRILQEGSVEAVSLANNHSRDYGWKGLENTERVLDEAGIGWARADSFWIYEKDGKEQSDDRCGSGSDPVSVSGSYPAGNGGQYSQRMRSRAWLCGESTDTDPGRH